MYTNIYIYIHHLWLVGSAASSWEVPGRRAGVQGRNGRYLATRWDAEAGKPWIGENPQSYGLFIVPTVVTSIDLSPNI